MAQHEPPNVLLSKDIQLALAWWGSLSSEEQYDEWLSFERRTKDPRYTQHWHFSCSSNKIREQWEYRKRPML